MHSVTNEFEARCLISEEKYFEIASLLFRDDPYLKVINQKNQYFDTDNLDLRENHITLRIRIIPHCSAVLTMKYKAEDGDVEISQTLSYFQHQHLLRKSHFPKGPVVTKLKSLGLPLSDIKYQCSLVTKRMQIDKEGYNYCLDQNDYNGVRDYNFEVEAESQAEAKKLLVEFAMKYNFEVEKGPGKSTRALLSIKKTQ